MKLPSDAGWASHLDNLLAHMAGLADASGQLGPTGSCWLEHPRVASPSDLGCLTA